MSRTDTLYLEGEAAVDCLESKTGLKILFFILGDSAEPIVSTRGDSIRLFWVFGFKCGK